MSQVSRPMQILLALTVVFAIAYFLVLKPGPVEEEPLPPVAGETAPPAADAGGAAAQTAAGQVIETANNAAADANAAVAQREGQTGEEAPAAAAPTGDPAAPVATTPSADGTAANAKTPEAKGPSAAQRRADAMLTDVGRDLKAGRVAVVLVYEPKGVEDKKLKKIVTDRISRRGGKVRVYTIPVSQIGRYDGLLGGLSLAQTPSTVVIAPDSTAKVLGGLTSAERIDRLTSAALRATPAEAAGAAAAPVAP